MPNPVVHFEILGKDGAKLQRFYSEAFGWKVDASNPLSYGMVDNDGDGINGGIAAADSPLAIFYIEVDDPGAYLKKVQSLGGKVVEDVTEIPGVVTFARFTDPDGNLVGLVKAE